jgi:DNA polymerase-1
MIGDDLRVRKIIPTIHPSAALRMYMYRLYIMKDFKRIKEESLTAEVDLPLRRLHVFPEYDDVIRYLSDIHWNTDKKRIAFDIEVSKSSEELTHISISHSCDYSMSIQFFKSGRNFFTPEQELDIIDMIGRILEDQTIPKIAHNGSFDFGFLFNKYGIIVKNMDDTMIAQGIVHPDMAKDLGFVVSTRSREPYYKDDGGKKHSGIGVDERTFAEYSAKDSAVLQDCWPSCERDIKQLHNEATYELTKKIIEPLVFMSEYGIKVDEAGRNAVAERKEKEKEELTEQLCQLVGYEINPDSPPQVMDYFYNKKKIKPYLKKGRPTSDDTALTRLVLRGYKEAGVLLSIRGLSASIPKYWRAKLSDGRLKCFYNPIGAADTGRLSSSKNIFDVGMNQQNQPPEVRQFYIPDDGYILCEVDLKQAEIYCVAYFGPVPEMIKAFENNIDIHTQTASFIFKKPMSDISREKGSTDIGGGKYSERDVGKHTDLGFNYGQSAQGFSIKNTIALEHSQKVRDVYFTSYPEIRDRFWQYVEMELKRSRRLTNPFGRTRLFLDRMDDALLREGYNYLPQSTVGSVINGFGLIPFYYEPQYKDVILLNQVHDSIGFQIPLPKPWSPFGWQETAKLLQSMKRQIEEPIFWRGSDFTIPAECKLGFNLLSYDKETNSRGLQEVDWTQTETTLANELRSKFNGS